MDTNEKINELPDSGERTEFETGSVRDSMKGKGFPSHLPPVVLRAPVCRDPEHGAASQLHQRPLP